MIPSKYHSLITRASDNMNLKDSGSKSRLSIAASKIWNHKRYSFLGALLYTFLVFVFGMFVHKSGFIRETVKPLIRENASLIPRVIGGMWSQPEHLIIDIKYKHFQKLAYQREIALAQGILMTNPEDYVPAMIRYKDKSVKVKLRLKGDWTDHLEGAKWSFRITVKGDNTIMGMKRFSIHHPKTRNYIYEWIFHQALKREGLIGLRYEFIKVTLNGKDLGIYALEEHFEKRLVEYNQLRDGPIVRFNENLMWEEKLQQRIPFPNAMASGSGFYLSSDIDGFQTTKWLSDPAGSSLYTNAIHLLELFRRGVLKTSEVFDIQKLSKFFAITDLVGAAHATLWHNVRFYYNPVTSRLEIIGFDADSGHLIKSISATHGGVYLGTGPSKVYDNYSAMIFSDIVFFREYVKTLERISERSYVDNLYNELDKELEQNLNILYSEFLFFDFSKEVLYRNQEYIKSVLNPVKGLHAYYDRTSGNRLELHLGNIQSLPIEVLNVTYKDSVRFLPAETVVLPAKLLSKTTEYDNVSFAFPESFDWSDTMIQDLKVYYKILGASQIKYETIFPYSYLDESFVRDDLLRQNPNVDNFDFLTVDESSKKIVIKPGDWTLKQNLIIPQGFSVICGAGTQINLNDSATILSYSPLHFRGNEEQPIIIQSADSTGQGIVVINANEKSVLQYVLFNNLSNPSQRGWELTGAVTFYESPVEIAHCRFIGNRSEDGLNIIRSEFAIDKSLFSHTQSDAFDADFTNGKITNSSFWACGNDGVDVSGSVIEIQNVVINGAGDKGLSAGENSRMTANQVEINNAEIAVASKDMSEVSIDNIKISDSKIAFTAYQKKPEFDAASITVTHLQKNKIEIPYLLEERSTLVVDAEVIKPNRKNVKEILYGVEFGKSSK